MTDTTIYAHAVGRIRAIEKWMLDRNDFERMIDAADPFEALRVIADAGYETQNGEIADYEKILSHELYDLYTLIDIISPEKSVMLPFRRKWDFHNAKVILKGELTDTVYDELLAETGVIKVDTLVTLIREREYDKLVPELATALKESTDIFNRTKDPQHIDLVLERAANRQTILDAGKTANSFLKGLFTIKTDLVNIKTFIRIKRIGGTPDFLLRCLLEGGKLKQGLFIECIDDGLEVFGGRLRYGPYGEVCEKGIESFMSNGELAELERLSDNFILEYVSKARYTAVGMEPLIAYVVAREMEMTNIRIVMVGRINGLSSESIRSRLRRTYG